MEPWRNMIVQGDCLAAIKALSDQLAGRVRLIYIDPPFFSGSEYSIKSRSKGSPESAPAMQEIATYSDSWQGGLDEYLGFMEERLEALRPLLRDDGSLWVHLDWHVVHYVKTILDRLFAQSNFVNEIIWKRTNSPKVQSLGFGSQHDVILLYARDSSRFRAQTVYRAHDEVSLRPYAYNDERGRFRLVEIEAQGIQRGESRKQFEWRGRTAPYLYTSETLDRWWEEGRIYRSRNGRYSKKQYLSERKGIPVSDLWLDIPPLQGSSAEYTGFVTQKPVALMSRILESSTERDDLVADFFAGSGTTAVAATAMGRRWIVCERSPVSVRIIEERLRGLRTENLREEDALYNVIRFDGDSQPAV